jgi:hypothetical protein
VDIDNSGIIPELLFYSFLANRQLAVTILRQKQKITCVACLLKYRINEIEIELIMGREHQKL